MKIYITTLFIVLMSMPAMGYELSYTELGSEIKWPEGQIDIYLDPSLEALAPADKIYQVVEESFLTWLDYVDDDITLNFVRESCTWSPKNCVNYGPSDFLGSADVWYNDWAEMVQVDITIGDGTQWGMPGESESADIQALLLHEVGHFWGLEHSDVPESIMHPVYNTSVDLTADDISGITALYGEDAVLTRNYPDEIDYSFTKCSVGPTVGITRSIFSLIF